MSFNTTLVLITLHLELDGYFSFFLKDYDLDKDFEVFYDSFKLAFERMLHLSTSSHFEMVFEHLRNCFHVENLVSGFL